VAAKRVAVVDIGTNSTRLLVADVRGDGLEELERKSTVTRLGQDVDRDGRLADEAMERVYAVLADYRERIDRHGAEQVAAVATSAVRDAANGEEFRAAVRERFGIEARTISGDEEAWLTFLGATQGRSGEAAETLVIDIGGGSTEFVVGHPGSRPRFHASTRLGSVRQTERHLETDPPRAGELVSLSEEAMAIIGADVPGEVRADVSTGIAVAGTATSLAAIDQALDPYDPERIHCYRLSLTSAERLVQELAALPLTERREVTGLDPGRAPTIVAGAAILVAAIRSFGLEAVEISEADILHGAALETSR
jgi:exopolyphosphatase / guanosine-5'-triphosphate,3'-diphosphate pyrophosphatase